MCQSSLKLTHTGNASSACEKDRTATQTQTPLCKPKENHHVWPISAITWELRRYLSTSNPEGMVSPTHLWSPLASSPSSLFNKYVWACAGEEAALTPEQPSPMQILSTSPGICMTEGTEAPLLQNWCQGMVSKENQRNFFFFF